MNEKKEKSRKLLWKKKKIKTKTNIGLAHDEEKPLTESAPKEDVKQVPVEHTKTNVAFISEITQGRINERPVDVGDVVSIPRNVVSIPRKSSAPAVPPANHNGINQRRPENGEAVRIADALDQPKGSERVHSFSNKSSEQSNSKSRNERGEIHRPGTSGNPAPKDDTVSFENEKTGSSKKKKGSVLLRSFRGKSSKKARKSLNEVFEEEATQSVQGTEKESPPEDEDTSSSEDKPDDWDDDPNNPFSSSFVPKEESNMQTIPVRVQRSLTPDRTLPLENEGTHESDRKDDVGEPENEIKKKKRKLKVPSFRKSKKADAPPSPDKSATLPGNLQDQSSAEITLLPDVKFRQTKLPDQQRLSVHSFESPDSFNSENQFLSREERNKSKQFSSMRVPNKQYRPVIHFKSEEKKEDTGDTFEEEGELPPNINKKSRQAAGIFSSFRKKKSPKKNELERVNEDETEDAEATEEHPSSFLSARSRPEGTGVRSSAPPNFAVQMSSADDAEGRHGTIAVSHTYLRKEEFQVTDIEPKQKRSTIGSIKKTLSFKRSSSDHKRERAPSSSSQQAEEDTIKEVDEDQPLTPDEEQFSLMYQETQYDVEESEVDIETRKRELENVFKDMESEEEEEEKPKPKNPKNIIKSFRKKAKKKKTDSESAEEYPLMDLHPSEKNKQTNTADQIIQVKDQLGELKDIAHDNIKKMEEREENLEELEDRADVLAQASTLFHKTAVEVKTEVEKSCRCNKKTKRIIIGVSIAVLILILIIIIAVLANKSDTKEVRTIHIIHVVNGTAPYNTPSPG
uniref:ABC transporter F family member 4-like isoform X2 n=1 Tax=Crassostrea virginica TaxID=6565 RepID=A0A8B8CQA0_CRAVI|nr:ABC transporter F family member 4-like isoform X2 [Crassostrea virginica]